MTDSTVVAFRGYNWRTLELKEQTNYVLTHHTRGAARPFDVHPCFRHECACCGTDITAGSSERAFDGGYYGVQLYERIAGSIVAGFRKQHDHGEHRVPGLVAPRRKRRDGHG